MEKEKTAQALKSPEWTIALQNYPEDEQTHCLGGWGIGGGAKRLNRKRTIQPAYIEHV